MDYATLARKMLEASAKAAKGYIKAQIKKDAANRYSLKAEWTLPALRSRLPVGLYNGEVVNVLSDGQQMLVWYNPFESTAERPICDGASRFPDVLFGVNLIPGSIAHDAWYREMEAIAKAFGVELSVVRKIGDDIFKSVNLAENEGRAMAKSISSLTYWGVRLFGGMYHERHKTEMQIIILAVIAAMGAAGCVSTAFDDPGAYQSPIYEKGE